MIRLKAVLQKFAQKGEKTAWTYIEIDAGTANSLLAGMKKSFRVKGKIDRHTFRQQALLPMGSGLFIFVVNKEMRSAIKKKKGDLVELELSYDASELILNPGFLSCLEDEPQALKYFQSLAGSHQRYFSKWIESAKTPATQEKRILQAVNALSKKLGYAEMIRSQKAQINP